MKRVRSGKADPIERQIELALRPGSFIGDRACFSFVGGLDKVIAIIDELAKTEPSRAVALYETLLAGCLAKADELDDSSGSFGQFAQEVVCRWIKGRQAAGADPDQTASTLLAWIDDDPYCFCHGIEEDAAAAFDKTGLAAFERQIRTRFAAASTQPREHAYRRWSEMLRAIYQAQRNLPAFIALAEQTGLKPEDCLSVAKLLAARKPGEALTWVKRGRALNRKSPLGLRADFGLDKLHRELLTRLGRPDEALAAAWAGFREDPSTDTYGDLMKAVPKAQRAEWRAKALDAANRAADLHSLLDLLVELKEIERLVDLVRDSTDRALENVTHYTMESAAKRLEKSHPGLAARLWRAQGMRIVNAGKSKYYEAALSNFERARKCYLKAGVAAEWERTVREVIAAHSRKSGFIGEFQALAGGAKREDSLSFLERAKARWNER